MPEADVREHCAEIDRCNQRGGRMLSVVDLIDAGTLPRELAAYALAAIGGGASFLVAALPGGAGKTTVMGALLNFVPRDVRLVPADGLAAVRRGAARTSPRCCFVCHEVGRGPYYAYLWGEALRAFFDLPAAGHTIATNLHADTYEQARDQVRGENGVGESAWRNMNLMLFLSVSRRGLHLRRRIATAWESDGRGPYRQVFDARQPAPLAGRSVLATADALAAAEASLESLLASGARTIEEVRAGLLEGWRRGG